MMPIVMFCIKNHKDWETEWNIMDDRNFARPECQMMLKWISYVAMDPSVLRVPHVQFIKGLGLK